MIIIIFEERGDRINYLAQLKWHMHKPESVHENKTHKILRDFEMQTLHQIPARSPNVVAIKIKRELMSSRFCRSSGPQIEN